MILTHVLLRADQYDRHVRQVLMQLWEPLALDSIEGAAAGDRVRHEEHTRMNVRLRSVSAQGDLRLRYKGAQAVKIIFSCRVPEGWWGMRTVNTQMIKC